eukprot:6286601-Prymnesium_polylepis.1
MTWSGTLWLSSAHSLGAYRIQLGPVRYSGIVPAHSSDDERIDCEQRMTDPASTVRRPPSVKKLAFTWCHCQSRSCGPLRPASMKSRSHSACAFTSPLRSTAYTSGGRPASAAAGKRSGAVESSAGSSDAHGASEGSGAAAEAESSSAAAIGRLGQRKCSLPNSASLDVDIHVSLPRVNCLRTFAPPRAN